MTEVSDVLVLLGLFGCVAALFGLLTWVNALPESNPETLVDRWRRLTGELPK